MLDFKGQFQNQLALQTSEIGFMHFWDTLIPFQVQNQDEKLQDVSKEVNKTK